MPTPFRCSAVSPPTRLRERLERIAETPSCVAMRRRIRVLRPPSMPGGEPAAGCFPRRRDGESGLGRKREATTRLTLGGIVENEKAPGSLRRPWMENRRRLRRFALRRSRARRPAVDDRRQGKQLRSRSFIVPPWWECRVVRDTLSRARRACQTTAPRDSAETANNRHSRDRAGG